MISITRLNQNKFLCRKIILIEIEFLYDTWCLIMYILYAMIQIYLQMSREKRKDGGVLGARIRDSADPL